MCDSTKLLNVRVDCHSMNETFHPTVTVQQHAPQQPTVQF